MADNLKIIPGKLYKAKHMIWLNNGKIWPEQILFFIRKLRLNNSGTRARYTFTFKTEIITVEASGTYWLEQLELIS